MKATEWRDAKIEKPRTYNDGVSDPVLVLTDDGIINVAEWNSEIGFWYDPLADETFGNVIWWFEFSLPMGFKFNEIYR